MKRWGRGGGGVGEYTVLSKKLIIEKLCYRPAAAYEVMGVSKFTVEISKYIVIDKTN